ncbi:hypothetical protein DX933_07950 [Ornithinibacillus gellani]|uniref:hypothetical protein n=1 Tax=Ornithinibacillus gellani TaxID=2293253 RepID=UPI000F481948|nr:hypothetical protein [Ornithinibacillus gellani]TQS75127.1 hypothetical protein DX933_07950 [Ornithinibacillus gellani]
MEKKVYILLSDTGSFFTKLIKLFTKKRYNHASISLDAALSDVYSFGRKKAGNPFVGGFVKEDVKQGLFTQADCAIYALSVTEFQFNQMKSFIQEIESEKESYRYNFLGLFGFIIKRPIKREKALFCSQFVASVLKGCHIIQFEQPLSLIAPCDLQELSELKLVYEGTLKAYHKGTGEVWNVPASMMPAK